MVLLLETRLGQISRSFRRRRYTGLCGWLSVSAWSLLSLYLSPVSPHPSGMARRTSKIQRGLFLSCPRHRHDMPHQRIPGYHISCFDFGSFVHMSATQPYAILRSAFFSVESHQSHEGSPPFPLQQTRQAAGSITYGAPVKSSLRYPYEFCLHQSSRGVWRVACLALVGYSIYPGMSPHVHILVWYTPCTSYYMSPTVFTPACPPKLIYSYDTHPVPRMSHDIIHTYRVPFLLLSVKFLDLPT